MLKLYNTLTRKKETFKPIGKEVGMYSCGPTVYDYPHVGNLRAFLFADLLKRYLLFKGFKIKHVMNITDVDDKLIKKSSGKKKVLKEVTNMYEKAFRDNLNELEIIPADFYPRATENIKEMLSIVKKLEEKGFAYKTSDGIYFSIKKFKDYGKFAGIKLENLKESARVDNDNYDKENAKDFALWKFWQEEDGDIFWESQFGKGRPGWHIECSAMSSKYLGEQFDIHTGGIDLVFPHHQNEIAQSEAAFGKKPWVKFWMHNAHLMVNGEKMSKSLGNFYVLKDLIGKGYSLNAIKYLLISTNYRQELDLTDKNLKASEEAVRRILDFAENAKNGDDGKISDLIEKTEKDFEKAMDDDLNIAKALGSLFIFIRGANKLGAGKKAFQFIEKINFVLGLRLRAEEKVPSEILKLVEERELARKAKNWKKADELREKINKLGFSIADSEEGPKIRKI